MSRRVATLGVYIEDVSIEEGDIILKLRWEPEEGAEAETSTPAPQPRPENSANTGVESLTDQERQTLRLIAEGMTNHEIADSMAMAADTVKKHIQVIIEKLGAVDRTHAVTIAFRGSVIQ